MITLNVVIDAISVRGLSSKDGLRFFRRCQR
jgi:hypothetical protein